MLREQIIPNDVMGVLNAAILSHGMAKDKWIFDGTREDVSGWSCSAAPAVFSVSLYNAKYLTSIQSYLTVSSAPRKYVIHFLDNIYIDNEASAKDVYKIRLISGLSWKKIAYIFDTSKKDVMSWAAGAEVPQDKVEHLKKTLETIKSIDSGSSKENRSALIEKRSQDETCLDLLRLKRYEDAEDIIGKGVGRNDTDGRLTQEEMELHAPRHWGKDMLETIDLDDGEPIMPIEEPSISPVEVHERST